jgi:hypothetical protein
VKQVFIAIRNGRIDTIEIPLEVEVIVREYDWVEESPSDLTLDDDGNFCVETVYTA